MNRVRPWSPTGIEYLHAITTLQQHARVDDPDGGMFEAADLQWWWRVDQHDDPGGALVLLDDDRPVAAAVRTRWTGRDGWALLGADGAVAEHADQLWRFVRDHLGDRPAEMEIRDTDAETMGQAERAGFRRTQDAFMTCWTSDPPSPGTVPSGYVLQHRAAGPHPMERRNGADVAARLGQCSLYDPALDLSVVAPDGTIAGYALFWADPVTGVGLVEPMRVEDAHQGHGIGGLLLRSGVRELTAAGCTRLKVTYEVDNEPAKRLYLGAGFVPADPSHTHRRESSAARDVS